MNFNFRFDYIQRKRNFFLSIEKSILFVFLTIGSNFEILAQTQCQDRVDVSYSIDNKKINWDVVPEFSLPFKLIYGGPRFGESSTKILSHGFSHINTFQNDRNLPPVNRALIYYNVAGGNQPWNLVKSPWGNSMEQYQQAWRAQHKRFTELFDDSNQSGRINSDIFLFDMERQIKTNDSILLLKTNNLVPNEYRTLSNQEFITTYKKDLQQLYFQPIQYFKALGLDSPLISAYGDGPIQNTFATIQANTWQKWTTDVSVLNYINLNFSTNKIGSNYFDAQHYIAPSAYYYFDYPSPFASDYLAYLLFQIEVNNAWTTKPIIPFIWLKYSQNAALKNIFIQDWMVEATAIFPFFSGAKGLWLWEDPTTFSDNRNYAAYERFIASLYRLSQFKDMFEGDYQLIMPQTAYDLYVARKPIIRAVKKNNFVLVAAHNPYAKSDAEVVETSIQVGNWRNAIQLTGYEVKLCKFDLSLLSNEIEFQPKVVVYPNPVNEYLEITYESIKNETVQIQLISETGKLLSEQSWSVINGLNRKQIKMADFHTKSFLIVFKTNGNVITKKVLIN